MEGSYFNPEYYEEVLRASFHIFAPGQVAIISYNVVSLKDYVILERSCIDGFIALVGGVLFPLRGSALNLGYILEEDKSYHILYQPTPISDLVAKIIQP